MPSSVCIITARGGSKRIPRKNVREFCGKPMLAYSVETAVASGIFDVVMVSTDDDEIADVARKYGAEVPFMRSEATSNDYATTADVLREVLSDYDTDSFVCWEMSLTAFTMEANCTGSLWPRPLVTMPNRSAP